VHTGAFRPALGAAPAWTRNRSASAAGPNPYWSYSVAAGQAEALGSFQRLWNVLDERGLAPSTELVEFERAIALDRSDLAWTAPTEAGEVPAR
jgi:hypothetical protein